MFIGHFGAGFAAKRLNSRPSLGTLFMASQFIDLLWPVFLILGIEHVEIDPGNTAFTPLDFVHYPFSHSFVGVLFWALLFGGVYFALRRDTRASLLLGALVLSHWLLDLVVHRPDLPLFPDGGVMLGLGLWNNVAATLLVEGLVFAAGVWVYMSATRAKNSRGNWALWSLQVFLVVVYIANAFGPAPTDTHAIGYAGLSMWLLVAWGYWADGNRNAVRTE